jgi:hypothetical protein
MSQISRHLFVHGKFPVARNLGGPQTPALLFFRVDRSATIFTTISED